MITEAEHNPSKHAANTQDKADVMSIQSSFSKLYYKAKQKNMFLSGRLII